MWLSEDTKALLLCLCLPFVVVKRKRGVGLDLYLCLELTLLGWLPGVMMAIFIHYRDVPTPDPREEEEPGLFDYFDDSFDSDDDDDDTNPPSPVAPRRAQARKTSHIKARRLPLPVSQPRRGKPARRKPPDAITVDGAGG